MPARLGAVQGAVRTWLGAVARSIREKWSANGTWLALGFLGIAVALGFVAIVQTVKLDSRHFYFQWGNAPEWFAAIGTVGAFLVYGLIYRHDRQTRRQDECRRREVEKRAQAELISGWIETYGRMGPAGDMWVHVGLINASRGVAYDVQVIVECQTITPGLFIPHSVGRGYLRVLPPSEGVVAIRLSDDRLRPTTLYIFFRDQKTNMWARDGLGRLTSVNTFPFVLPHPGPHHGAGLTAGTFDFDAPQEVTMQPKS